MYVTNSIISLVIVKRNQVLDHNLLIREFYGYKPFRNPLNLNIQLKYEIAHVIWTENIGRDIWNINSPNAYSYVMMTQSNFKKLFMNYFPNFMFWGKCWVSEMVNCYWIHYARGCLYQARSVCQASVAASNLFYYSRRSSSVHICISIPNMILSTMCGKYFCYFPPHLRPKPKCRHEVYATCVALVSMEHEIISFRTSFHA